MKKNRFPFYFFLFSAKFLLLLNSWPSGAAFSTPSVLIRIQLIAIFPPQISKGKKLSPQLIIHFHLHLQGEREKSDLCFSILAFSAISSFYFQMSSKTDWLVCGLCGAKVRTAQASNRRNRTSFQVRQLFNNPSHRKLLARLLVQDIEKIPTKYNSALTSWRWDDWLTDYCRLCLVCTVKTQTVNEFQEFACKHLKLKTPWKKCSWRKIFHSDDLSLFNLYLVKYISGLKKHKISILKMLFV